MGAVPFWPLLTIASINLAIFSIYLDLGDLHCICSDLKVVFTST